MAKFTGHPITDDSALGGSVIERSLRIDQGTSDSDSGSNYSRTFASGNRKTFTISVWVKKCNTPGNIGDDLYTIISCGGGGTGSYAGNLAFNTSDQLVWSVNNPAPSTHADLTTTRKFRDPSAWYHIVFVADTTQGTNSNRLKLYVDGVQETDFASTTYPSQNYDLYFNLNVQHRIGSNSIWSDLSRTYGNFNGYFAEINFVDGSALDPSHFGYTESQTGLWRPKRFDKSRIPNKKGTTFSSTWTASGNGFGSAPVTRAYAGDLSSYANNSAGGQILTWNTSTYNLSGNLRIYCYSNGGAYDIYVNGNATKVADTPSESGNVAWVDCGTFDHIKEIQFAGTTYNTSNDLGGGGVYFSGFMVDGTLLRDDMDEFGTNGFHLDFSDNSSTTTLGLDKSGQGNNFTPEDVSVSAGYDNDSVLDTPTNNFVTLNYNDRNSNALLANGGLQTVATSTGGHYPVFTTLPIKSGKWYLEFDSEADGMLPSIMEAVHDSGSHNTDSTVGNNTSPVNKRGYGLLTGDGRKSHNGTYSSYGSRIHGAGGDVGMCAFDADNGKIYWGKNNTWFDSGNPVTGANPAFSGIDMTKDWLFTFHVYGNNNNVKVKFGSQGFTYTPPTGFKALSSKNLPPNVPSTIRPQKHFDVILYTGQNTSSLYNVTGLEFSPDLVIGKARNDTIGHIFIDTVRGDDKQIETPDNSAEVTRGTPSYRFLKDGFAVSTGGNLNNPVNYVAWCWKAGGTAVTNTDGTINTQVSVNEEAGFSIATYTGNGATTATIGHGLGKTPDWIMIKNRSSSADWVVMHKGIGSYDGGNYKHQPIKLNSSGAKTSILGIWQTPNSSTQQISDGQTSGSNRPLTNASGDNYVAYFWAEIPGFSKFGYYYGNGNSDGSYVHLGFRPAWLMVKKTNTANSWVIFDAKRSTTNLVDDYLIAEGADAEATSANVSVDFLSNGVKFRSGYDIVNAGDYIYMAFAEQPGTTPFDTFPNAR